MSAALFFVVLFGVWVVCAAIGFAKKQSAVISVGGGFLAACITLLAVGMLTGSIKLPKSSTEVDLNAAVRFTGAQFVIENIGNLGSELGKWV